MYTLATAAAACGVNRSTILRAIKAGKISASRNEHGEYDIQPAEVHRVYPPVVRNSAQPDAPQQYAQPDATTATAAFEAQIAALKAVNEMLTDQVGDLREDRDRWRSMAETTARQLPPPPTSPVRTERRGWFWRRAG